MLKLSTQGFDEPIFTELQQMIVDLPRNLDDKALEATVRLEAEIEQIYKTAPPRGKEKFVWSLDAAKNQKAMGWWFWQLGLGNISTDGNHYKRQGNPPYGVVANLSQMQYSVTIQVVMTNPKMRFTFGQLKEPNTQLPGHRRTGWNYAFPLVNEALKRATNYIVDAMMQELEAI